jgi:hypothetical protein
MERRLKPLFTMLTPLLLGSFLTDWIYQAQSEFTRGFNSMSVTQWGIVSAVAVIFGFLCLKGNAVRE